MVGSATTQSTMASKLLEAVTLVTKPSSSSMKIDTAADEQAMAIRVPVSAHVS